MVEYTFVMMEDGTIVLHNTDGETGEILEDWELDEEQSTMFKELIDSIIK